jgi:hypothetical protein
MDWLTTRLQEGKGWLEALLSAPKLRFDESIRSKLPERHGVYAISTLNAPLGVFLRAGRTRTAGDGLRQRLYQNHLMGSQKGNLRWQLVRDGQCGALEETKPWIRANCQVQFIVVEDPAERTWAEYLVLSILRPKYCD